MIASPITTYVESSLNKVMPLVKTIKTQLDDKVVPLIPHTISECVNTKVSATKENVTAAVDKMDGLVCSGIDQVTERATKLREASSKLVKDTKSSVSSYLTDVTDYAASFSVAQLALKLTDVGLDVVEGVLTVGAGEQSAVLDGVKKIHTSANTIRISGMRKAGRMTE